MLHKVLGISPTTSSDALYWMEHCLAANVGQSYYFGLDWQSRANLPALDSPRNSRLRPKTAGNKEKTGPTVEEILALGRKKGTETICGMLIDEICRLLRLPGDKITPSTPLVSQGMDSLMTQDIGIIIEQKFGLEDYRVALSENATPLSLADALYLHLGSGQENDEAAREDTEKNRLHELERQHGFHLSEQELEDMARSMAEPAGAQQEPDAFDNIYSKR
jgi:acyl carrier protein